MLRISGFSSSIFFEMKRLSEVNKLDVTSLLCLLLSTKWFEGINHSTYLFYDVLKSVFQTFCKHRYFSSRNVRSQIHAKVILVKNIATDFSLLEMFFHYLH